MRAPAALTTLMLSGCLQDEVAATWLEGFGYAWQGFNHRVSYLHFGADEAGLDAGVVGGASSTGWAPELAEGCDEELCKELQFTDESEAALAWARISSDALAAGVAEATVIATAAGAESTISVPLQGRARGDAIAIIQALTLDTDHALAGGEGCFQPSLGWHPRRIAASLDEATLADDGERLEVTLWAAFEAGLSFEEYRACQDAVIDEAQVLITLRVLGLVSEQPQAELELSHEAEYAFSGNQYDPEEQPEPDLADRPLELAWPEAIAGWSSLDFRFHQQDDELRGAYLRSVSVGLDQDQGWASGHATNYSPGTQLSGFDYSFEGRISAMEAPGAVERGSVTLAVEAELDDEHRPEPEHQDW